jgi:HIRAN domain-containing protein
MGAADPERARLRLWLERGELEGGSGFWLREAASGDALRWDDDRLAAGGAYVVRVAGASYRLDALQDEGFAPGSRLALVPEPENEHDPNAVGVWDADRRVQAGYVPADVAPALELPLQAVALWEWREGGRRVGLRVLVAPPAVWIGVPR